MEYTVTRMTDGSWVIDPEPPAEDRQAIIDACLKEERERGES